MAKHWFGLASALVLCSCGDRLERGGHVVTSADIAESNVEQAATIQRRASFDLSCPEEQVEVVELEHDDYNQITALGVQGCGKKATYVRMSPTTTWLMDSASNGTTAPEPVRAAQPASQWDLARQHCTALQLVGQGFTAASDCGATVVPSQLQAELGQI